jgi:uncharacterized protein YjdB
MRRRFAPAALIAALLMLAALIACGGSSSSSTTTSTNTIQTITLTPATVSVGINQSTNFIATATDSNGNQVSNITYSWTSDAPTIAIVNNSGLATALSPGIAKITASVTVSSSTGSSGTNTINSAPSTLNVIPPVSKVTISPVSAQIAVGQTQQFTAKVTDVNGTPIAGVLVTWSDSNAAVVSIDANGLARGISPGGPVAIVAQAGGVQSSPAQLTVTQ